MDQQPTTKKPEQKLAGALLTFVVLQLIYLFFFFITFPDSFRNALDFGRPALSLVASWLSSITMLGYCIACLVAVAQLVMKRSSFLFWFQVSGGIALVGNFIVYILNQIAASIYDYRYSSDTDYHWVLFIMALFWTVIWCMYFARSSRVFSYMGEDPAYLQTALFTKNLKVPAPWVDPRTTIPAYRPPMQQAPQAPGAPVPPVQQGPAPYPAPMQQNPGAYAPPPQPQAAYPAPSSLADTQPIPPLPGQPYPPVAPPYPPQNPWDNAPGGPPSP